MLLGFVGEVLVTSCEGDDVQLESVKLLEDCKEVGKHIYVCPFECQSNM